MQPPILPTNEYDIFVVVAMEPMLGAKREEKLNQKNKYRNRFSHRLGTAFQ
jgi:hypothetical protein